MNKFQQNQIIFFIFIVILLLFIFCDYRSNQLENFTIYTNHKNTNPGYGGYGGYRGIPDDYNINDMDKCEKELKRKEQIYDDICESNQNMKEKLIKFKEQKDDIEREKCMEKEKLFQIKKKGNL